MGRRARWVRSLLYGLALAIPLVASVAGASADLLRGARITSSCMRRRPSH